MKGLLKYLALLAVVVLVAAACSSDDSESGSDTTAAGDDTTTTAAAGDDTTTTAAASGDATQIDFWVAFSDEARLGFSEEKAAEFNAKHPEYNVQVTSFASYN
ncbi:MAG: hypothetical protein WBO25_08730, partial [Acidimicrobiia bacterium]